LQAIGYHVVIVNEHSRSNRRPVESKLQIQEKIDLMQSLAEVLSSFNPLDLTQFMTIPSEIDLAQSQLLNGLATHCVL
jgi:hypothetical protein